MNLNEGSGLRGREQFGRFKKYILFLVKMYSLFPMKIWSFFLNRAGILEERLVWELGMLC